jgi:hypothetical protein
MGDGYSRSPRLVKGAIVQFSEMPLIPIPNIIIFQYNPESLSRSLTPFKGLTDEQKKTYDAAGGDRDKISKLYQPWDPEESFNLTLFLDATDALESPETHPVAFISGVADRLAALEMLLYAPGDSVLGQLLGTLSFSLSGGVSFDKTVPSPKVPITLFVWGTGRIVPVRLQTFNVEETQWNMLLYPTRARVTIGMKVITSKQLGAEDDKSLSVKIAKFCYDFTRAQKELLALANVANTVESIAGPF